LYFEGGRRGASPQGFLATEWDESSLGSANFKFETTCPDHAKGRALRRQVVGGSEVAGSLPAGESVPQFPGKNPRMIGHRSSFMRNRVTTESFYNPGLSDNSARIAAVRRASYTHCFAPHPSPFFVTQAKR
jgi:hypothetical protein